jgi:hypothetical protein
MCFREAHEREHVRLGFVEHVGELWEAFSELISDGAPLIARGL